MAISRFFAITFAAATALGALEAGAQSTPPAAFTVQSVEGEAKSDTGALAAGDRSGPTTVSTGPSSKASLRFDDGMEVALGEKSVLRVAEFTAPTSSANGRVSLDMRAGMVQIKTGEIVRTAPDQFALRTPRASVRALEPADFSVALRDGEVVDVNSGSVRVSSALGDQVVRAGATVGIPAAAAAQTPATKAAAARRMWIGLSAGASRIDQAATAKLIDSGTVDETSTGFKLFAGYQLHRYIAAEIAYVDLGKLSYDGTFGGAAVTGGKLKLSGVDIAALGTLPLSERFSAFAKLGLFMWRSEASDTTNGTSFSAKTNGRGPSLGLGANFTITPPLAVRLEAETFKFADSHARLLSAGVMYRF